MKQLELVPNEPGRPTNGVILDDAQVLQMLGLISLPVDKVLVIDLLRTRGWGGAAGALERAIADLRDSEPGWRDLSGLMDLVDSWTARPLHALALETALRGRRFGVVQAEWFQAAELGDLPLDLLRTGLTAAVDAAVVDVRRAVTPVQAIHGDAFPHLGTWLEDIAPLVEPDVVARFAWFLGSFCDRVEGVPMADGCVLSEPVLTWWPDDSEELRMVLDLLEDRDRWMPVLGDEFFEGAVEEARTELGLDDEDAK